MKKVRRLNAATNGRGGKPGVPQTEAIAQEFSRNAPMSQGGNRLLDVTLNLNPTSQTLNPKP